MGGRVVCHLFLLAFGLSSFWGGRGGRGGRETWGFVFAGDEERGWGGVLVFALPLIRVFGMAFLGVWLDEGGWGFWWSGFLGGGMCGEGLRMGWVFADAGVIQVHG